MRNRSLLSLALLAASAAASPRFHNRESNNSTASADLSSTSAISSLTEAVSTSAHAESSALSEPSLTEAVSTSASYEQSTLSGPSSTEAVSTSASYDSSKDTQSLSASSTYSESGTEDVTTLTISDISSSSTSLHPSNASITAAPTVCTGCVLEALFPTTLSFEEEWSSAWTYITVTEHVINSTITYMDGSSIVSIETEFETISATKTVVTGPSNQTLSLSTPVFRWVPVAGTTVTLAAGATYVAYTDIWGGLDFNAQMPEETGIATATTDIFSALTTSEPDPSCAAAVHLLPVYPSSTEDYYYYIETYADAAPTNDELAPVSLPPGLIEHLKSYAEITSIFSGSDIATCTLRPTEAPGRSESLTTSTKAIFTSNVPFLPSPSEPLKTTPAATAPMETPPPPALSSSTGTWLSTSHTYTSVHVTRDVCVRCSSQYVPKPPGGPSEQHDRPPPSQTPDNKPNVKPTDLPGIIASIINNPQFTPPNNPQDNKPGQTVTIGNSGVPVRPAPTYQPNNPSQHNPGVVVGSETLTPGQTTTINGVEVVVPSQGGGSSIVIGGSTVVVNPAPTGQPVITVGDNTVTANPQGQFVVGTQTLTPGGPAITVDGSTLSLGPSGTIAVVNGVTQTLANAPGITGAPVLTVGSQTVRATLVGGSTQYILGGQTLTPGGVVIVDGTTLSMPADGQGSTIVVNGVTSTLDAPGLPVITLNGQSFTASAVGGTTAFIMGPGATLTPGGVLTISGTTFSMPVSGSGSVVVIDGKTSTLGSPITVAPALTINGKTYSATVRDGTTEYVLGPGKTLKPGEAITISGTTYSLDEEGTALVINGKTSSIPKTPASNSATTTKSGSSSESSSASTSISRNPGNFIASGIGASSKGVGVPAAGGVDRWAEGVIIAIAGWLLMLF